MALYIPHRYSCQGETSRTLLYQPETTVEFNNKDAVTATCSTARGQRQESAELGRVASTAFDISIVRIFTLNIPRNGQENSNFGFYSEFARHQDNGLL